MMEDTLFARYRETIVFCAHTITFFHNNPNAYRSRNVWLQFDKDFKNVLMNIRALIRRVGEAAGVIKCQRRHVAARPWPSPGMCRS